MNFAPPSCVLLLPPIFSIIKIRQKLKQYMPLFIRVTEIPGSSPFRDKFLLSFCL
jgi:hypothetical protein